VVSAIGVNVVVAAVKEGLLTVGSLGASVNSKTEPTSGDRVRATGPEEARADGANACGDKLTVFDTGSPEGTATGDEEAKSCAAGCSVSRVEVVFSLSSAFDDSGEFEVTDKIGERLATASETGGSEREIGP
jgi:hypothetical protein